MAFYSAVILLAAANVGQHGTRSIDPDCVGRLKDDAQLAWRAAASVEQDLEVDYTSRSETTPTARSKSLATIKEEKWKIVWYPRNKRKMISHEYIGSGSRNISCYNDRYKFEVKASSGGAREEYELLSATKYNSADEFDNVSHLEGDVLYTIGSGYRILDVPLQELLNSDMFKINKAEYVKESYPAIRVEWLCAGGAGPWKTKGAEYWAVLNPDNGWLIDRAGIKQPGKSTYEQAVAYQDFGSVKFPKRVDVIINIKNAKVTQTYEFNKPIVSATSNSKFYLSFYGYSESVLGLDGGWRWTGILPLLVGVAGIGLSFYLYSLSKRASPASGA